DASAPRRDGDLRLPADRVSHRPAVDLAADCEAPELLAGARVERDEIAFLAAAENDIARGRQHTAPRDVGHLVFPLRLERLRVVSADYAVRLVIVVEERQQVRLAHLRLRGVHADAARELALDRNDPRVLP